MKNILTIKKLNAGYGDLQILEDVSMNLEKGTITVLMGPNGAGKSTLLKSVYNLTNITSGSITYQKHKLTQLSAHKLLNLGIAFVSQGKVNFGTLSVKDNLRLGAHHIKDKQYIEKQLKKVFQLFPILKERQKEYAFTLSGGQQQMLAIARALMSNPSVLLMDEPSLGLSPKFVKDVFAAIANIRDTFDTSILIVEHNIKSLFDIADNAVVLVQGKVVAQDTCQNLKESAIMKQVFVGKLE